MKKSEEWMVEDAKKRIIALYSGGPPANLDGIKLAVACLRRKDYTRGEIYQILAATMEAEKEDMIRYAMETRPPAKGD